MVGESIVWSGTSSQWSNFKIYLTCGFVCLAVIVLVITFAQYPLVWYGLWLLIPPLLAAMWAYVKIRFGLRYEISTERMRIITGIFTRRTEEIELYRVKDTALIEPFWLRMVGLGNVELSTSDHSTPIVTIVAVPKPAELRETIRHLVETNRDRKGVKEVDFKTGEAGG